MRCHPNTTESVYIQNSSGKRPHKACLCLCDRNEKKENLLKGSIRGAYPEGNVAWKENPERQCNAMQETTIWLNDIAKVLVVQKDERSDGVVYAAVISIFFPFIDFHWMGIAPISEIAAIATDT